MIKNYRLSFIWLSSPRISTDATASQNQDPALSRRAYFESYFNAIARGGLATSGTAPLSLPWEPQGGSAHVDRHELEQFWRSWSGRELYNIDGHLAWSQCIPLRVVKLPKVKDGRNQVDVKVEGFIWRQGEGVLVTCISKRAFSFTEWKDELNSIRLAPRFWLEPTPTSFMTMSDIGRILLKHIFALRLEVEQSFSPQNTRSTFQSQPPKVEKAISIVSICKMDKYDAAFICYEDGYLKKEVLSDILSIGSKKAVEPDVCDDEEINTSIFVAGNAMCISGVKSATSSRRVHVVTKYHQKVLYGAAQVLSALHLVSTADPGESDIPDRLSQSVREQLVPVLMRLRDIHRGHKKLFWLPILSLLISRSLKSLNRTAKQLGLANQ